MKTHWLINPFERVAGWKALIIGLCFMSLIAIIGKVNHLFFGRIFYVTLYPHTFFQAFYTQIIVWGVLFIVMWIAGKIFSKSKIRVIDVAGTMALSRAPMLLIVFLGFLPFFSNGLSQIFNLLCVILYIWMVGLMYNAYSVSCNLNGSRGILSFIGALIAAEIISILICSSLLSAHTSCASDMHQAKDIEITIPQEQEQAIKRTAEIVIEAFKQSDIKTVRDYFDETMKNGLSETALRTTWTSMTTLSGNLKSADTNVKAKRSGNYVILLIPCTFEKGALNIQLAFNSDGKISGLFFKP